nr:hypothetical protein Iba_chr06aCG8190 [Ipomoea batatas]
MLDFREIFSLPSIFVRECFGHVYNTEFLESAESIWECFKAFAIFNDESRKFKHSSSLKSPKAIKKISVSVSEIDDGNVYICPCTCNAFKDGHANRLFRAEAPLDLSPRESKLMFSSFGDSQAHLGDQTAIWFHQFLLQTYKVAVPETQITQVSKQLFDVLRKLMRKVKPIEV